MAWHHYVVAVADDGSQVVYKDGSGPIRSGRMRLTSIGPQGQSVALWITLEKERHDG